MRILLALSIIVSLAAVPGMATERFSGSTYSISVPDGWVQIPPYLVTRRMTEISKDQNLLFPFAFQLESNKTWFGYPYVVIETGDYPAEKEPTEDQIIEIAKKAGGSGSTPQVDMANHRFVVITRQNVQGTGPMTRQINGHFGRTQTVFVDAYAREGDFETYVAQFNQINNSFQWDRREEYQARVASTSDQLLGRIVAGVVLGIIVGVLRSVIKKRKTT